MNYEQCLEFLSHSNKDIDVDSQTLIEIAFNYKITNSLLADLELFYRLQNRKGPAQLNILKAFKRLSLHQDSQSKKMHWLVLPATPDDIIDLIKKSIKENKEIKEENIQMFF